MVYVATVLRTNTGLMCGIILICPDMQTSREGKVVGAVADKDQAVYPTGPSGARQTATAAEQDTGGP